MGCDGLFRNVSRMQGGTQVVDTIKKQTETFKRIVVVAVVLVVVAAVVVVVVAVVGSK